jgi:hypothetical protein
MRDLSMAEAFDTSVVPTRVIVGEKLQRPPLSRPVGVDPDVRRDPEEP